MGVSVLYQAIPARSTLYRRLQKDKAFTALFTELFPYGSGVFDYLSSEPASAEETLNAVLQRLADTLAPEPEKRQQLTEFLAEVERTRAEHPGIESQTAALEKCSLDVEDRLARRLANRRRGASQWVKKLIFGDQSLAAPTVPEVNQILGVVSQKLVREGARALKPLPPYTLFRRDGWEGWCRDNYRRWRRLYMVAAAKAEVILVGVA
jgi:hypothetical protein